MHPYVERFREELEKNPPNYGYQNANSLLEMLYMWYAEWNPINSAQIRQDYFMLADCFSTGTEEKLDHALDIVTRLCQQHEQLAFLEGVRVGFRLGQEL